MDSFHLKELISQKGIEERLLSLANEINEFFKNESFIAIGVLKGALFFMADLLRMIENCEAYDFIQAKSYLGIETSGKIEILKEPNISIKDKNVLVIEDILDTGITANAIKNYLIERGAKNVYFCTFLDKPSRRVNFIKPDFCGYTIDNYFVVGYGLDYNEKFREKRGIYILEFDVTKL